MANAASVVRDARMGVCCVLAMMATQPANAQQNATSVPSDIRIEADLQYARKSGMVLTMDAFIPVRPNGAAIVHVVSGSWFTRWVAPAQAAGRLTPLLDAGFTVFTVRHSNPPHFGPGDALADLRRSLVFLRSQATRFAIDTTRIGVYGTSAGGHLALLLAATTSAKANWLPVRAVAAVSAPTMPGPFSASLTQVIAQQLPSFAATDSLWPSRVATSRMPPTMLLHGELDDVVPVEHGRRFHQLLDSAKVTSSLQLFPTANHDMDPFGFHGERGRESMRLIVSWFTQHLLKAP